jgi:hypothetical protein
MVTRRGGRQRPPPGKDRGTSAWAQGVVATVPGFAEEKVDPRPPELPRNPDLPRSSRNLVHFPFHPHHLLPLNQATRRSSWLIRASRLKGGTGVHRRPFPGPLSRRGPRVPRRRPFWIAGRKDLWEDPGLWELLVHGNPPALLPQARILPGNPGIWHGSRPARTTRHHRTRPPGMPAELGPERDDQTRSIASILDRQAERPPAQLVWPTLNVPGVPSTAGSGRRDKGLPSRSWPRGRG